MTKAKHEAMLFALLRVRAQLDSEIRFLKRLIGKGGGDGKE